MFPGKHHRGKEMDQIVTGEHYRFLDVDRLKRGRWQPRKRFEEKALKELADSIEEVGIIEPIIVRFDKRDGKYEIISGERRWRASQLAMCFSVKVIIRNDLSDSQAHKMSLIENLQREDLNPIEEAEGIKALINDFNYTHLEAGSSISKSRSYVTNSLRLLELSLQVQELLISGSLEMGHAKHLGILPHKFQTSVGEQAARLGWGVRQVSKKVEEIKKLLVKGELDLSEEKDPNIVSLENEISDYYSIPTHLEYDSKNAKGKLVFEWNSLDELHGLLESWGLRERQSK
jgi:ParB family transcriptional regulator, chromosome partitioning protein